MCVCVRERAHQWFSRRLAAEKHVNPQTHDTSTEAHQQTCVCESVCARVRACTSSVV